MINLVMILHSHQPIGNFDKVFELAHEECYRPFLEIFAAHPTVHAGLHFSGCLLEWLEAHKPATIDLLGTLIQRGQIEPLSGGFFEPLLATIPVRDARGQLAMMNDYLEKRFGRRPTGFWLTERIWDQSLPAALAGTGLDYTIVDDTHFYYAGLKFEDIFGYYMTEREGHPLKILATPLLMRYMIPFRLIENVIAQLKEWEQVGRRIAVYGDDGEKFGLWPGTHEWVIKKGWLEKFFEEIEKNADWLRAVQPSKYLSENQPSGRIYMPQASYEEMTEWALPSDRSQALAEIITTLKAENRWETWRPFIRGGIWDNFLVKYDESNRLHKKMVYLSGKADQAIHQSAKSDPRQDQALKTRDFVWRAQCNCAYWHGIFGGLYMGHLRRAIHENLVRAQKLLTSGDQSSIALDRLDYDLDGREEIFITSPSLSLGLAPSRGGGIFDISHLAKGLNLADVLTRRPEAYHRRLLEMKTEKHPSADVASIHDQVKVKEPNLDLLLKYDSYTRLSLLDHFWAHQVSPDDLVAGNVKEQGDFVQGEYEVIEAMAIQGRARVVLARRGLIGSTPINLTKSITLGFAPTMTAAYELEGPADQQIQAVFACEFNLSLFSDQDGTRYLYAPENGRRREVYETGGEYHLSRFDLINGPDSLKVSFTFSQKISVHFHPLYTVSMSEDGFEKTYQGTSLFFFFTIDLKPGQKEKFTLNMELIDI